MSGFKRIVNIIPLTRVALSSPQIFTYLVPLQLQDQLRLGQLAHVPFGKKRTVLGLVSSVEMHRLPSEIKGLKEIKAMLESEPVLTHQGLALAKYLSEYYILPLGIMIKAMLPKFTVKAKSPDLVGYEKFNPDFVLNEHQRAASTQIINSLDKASTFLVKGVTGSGKTEVYMQVIQRLLDRGKQIIILVPEISLTVQAIERFARRFGIEKIALFHSRLKDAEKLWMWHQIRNQSKQIIIGPRSAIFSPVQNLGLIILDEEHDPSFKQYDQNPKYHARDVAEKLSELWQCPLVLGDATPSLETYLRTLTGKVKLLELPYRIKADVGMPRVQIIDL
ncbi:MAG: DEAD/DEAH box helicase family protein, partial [bacterium]|nr:DEAD/DEAH box helicase family protein [bacterium]